MIADVNTGMCQWRATNGKPCHFVNYTEDGENKYEFFFQIWARERRYQELIGLSLL